MGSVTAESLKQINLSDNLREHIIFDKRPEQLSVDQFVDLTNLINQDLKYQTWKKMKNIQNSL